MVHDSVSFGPNQLSGPANIDYSSCALLRALDSTWTVAPARARGWARLF
jgi:hypothetical protein